MRLGKDFSLLLEGKGQWHDGIEDKGMRERISGEGIPECLQRRWGWGEALTLDWWSDSRKE